MPQKCKLIFGILSICTYTRGCGTGSKEIKLAFEYHLIFSLDPYSVNNVYLIYVALTLRKHLVKKLKSIVRKKNR